MRRKGFSVSPERAAAVEVDPGLVLAAIGKMAASGQRALTGFHELLPLCAETYAEHVGFEPGVDEHGFEVIAALFARMSALTELMDNGRLEPGDASAEATAEATSAARLMRVDDRFRFQPREFFALLDRAETGPRR